MPEPQVVNIFLGGKKQDSNNEDSPLLKALKKRKEERSKDEHDMPRGLQTILLMKRLAAIEKGISNLPHSEIAAG